MMNLRSLVEKSADAALLRKMIGFAAEKLMAMEVGVGPREFSLCVSNTAFHASSFNEPFYTECDVRGNFPVRIGPKPSRRTSCDWVNAYSRAFR
jgi:hypothetical protein